MNNVPESIRKAVASIMKLDDSVIEFAEFVNSAFGVGQIDERDPSPNYQPLPEDYTLPGAMDGLVASLDILAHVCETAADAMLRTGGEAGPRRRRDHQDDELPISPESPATEATGEEVPAQKTVPGTVELVPTRIVLDPPAEEDGVNTYAQNEAGEWEPVEPGATHETTPINGVHSPGVMQVDHIPEPAKTPGNNGRERRTSGKKRPPKDR